MKQKKRMKEGLIPAQTSQPGSEVATSPKDGTLQVNAATNDESN